jgi:hypothetical protein
MDFALYRNQQRIRSINLEEYIPQILFLLYLPFKMCHATFNSSDANVYNVFMRSARNGSEIVKLWTKISFGPNANWQPIFLIRRARSLVWFPSNPKGCHQEFRCWASRAGIPRSSNSGHLARAQVTSALPLADLALFGNRRHRRLVALTAQPVAYFVCQSVPKVFLNH